MGDRTSHCSPRLVESRGGRWKEGPGSDVSELRHLLDLCVGLGFKSSTVLTLTEIQGGTSVQDTKC